MSCLNHSLATWVAESASWEIRFMNRHADADLLNLLQTSVPPADVCKIDLFKAHLSKYQQKASRSRVDLNSFRDWWKMICSSLSMWIDWNRFNYISHYSSDNDDFLFLGVPPKPLPASIHSRQKMTSLPKQRSLMAMYALLCWSQSMRNPKKKGESMHHC